MKVHFNLAFDGLAWPGVLWELGKGGWKQRQAVAGEAWVGPRGLLSILETQLGLVWNPVSAAERDAALVAAVQETNGFWSPSAEVDPLAVASTLRKWRDYLLLHGWRPRNTPRGRTKRPRSRIDQLALVTRDVESSLPDRALAVVAELKARAKSDSQELKLSDVVLLAQPSEELPALWRRLLETLESAGVRFQDKSFPTPKRRKKDSSDLSRCMAPEFQPEGDGTLQLFRPTGPLAAAEQLAAWLASQPDPEDTLFIGGDALLDAALNAQGLPTTGAASASDGDPLLAILPHVLALAWKPQDPQCAADLLQLRTSPVPPGMAAGLLDALQRRPAVGSKSWNRVLGWRLEKYKDEDRRARVADRVERIFTPDVEGDEMPASALQSRTSLVEDWARGRRRGAERDDDGRTKRWDQVISQCVILRQLTETLGLTSVSELELGDLVSQATAAADIGGESFDAEAGPVALRSPSALVGPARRVVWWNFTASSAERPFRLPLSSDDLDQLAAQEAELPDTGRQSAWLRRHWRRPFELASETLLLVSPCLDEKGEASSPHPVWDEISAALTEVQRPLLVRDAPGSLRLTRRLKRLDLPQPTEIWETDEGTGVPLPEKLSPTGMDSFLGCPLQHVLSSVAGIGSSLPVQLELDPMLFGNLAHAVLERLLKQARESGLPDPEEATARAGAIFDDILPRRAPALLLPRNEMTRLEVRQYIIAAAAELVRLLRSADAQIGVVEEKLTRQWKGRPLNGKADAILSSPSTIIDHKWGGATRYTKYIRSGTALQLAAYSYLLQSREKTEPALAYYFITTRRMITNRPDLLPGAVGVSGPPVSETWAAAGRAVNDTLAQLAEGVVLCAGTPEDPEDLLQEPMLEDGRLWLEPKCIWCEFSAICQTQEVR